MITVRAFEEIAQAVFDEVAPRKAAGGVEVIGIPTGLATIDSLTGGLQKAELTVIGARTGVGKTSIALNMVLNAVKMGHTALLYSLEMSGESLFLRLLAGMTGISSGRIRRGKISDDEWRQLHEAARELSSYRLGIIDQTITSQQVVETSMMIHEQSPVGLVVVDYIGIMADSNREGKASTVADICKNLKTLSMPDHLNAPVVALSQLNRATEGNEDGVPRLSNLAESDSVGRDADVVLLLHRPYLNERLKGAPALDQEEAEIIVAKNRNGPANEKTKAIFFPKTMTWVQERKKIELPKGT